MYLLCRSKVLPSSYCQLPSHLRLLFFFRSSCSSPRTDASNHRLFPISFELKSLRFAIFKILPFCEALISFPWAVQQASASQLKNAAPCIQPPNSLASVSPSFGELAPSAQLDESGNSDASRPAQSGAGAQSMPAMHTVG